MQFNLASIAAKKGKIVNPTKQLLMTQGKQEEIKKLSDNLSFEGERLCFVSLRRLELNCLGRNPSNFLPHKSILSKKRSGTKKASEQTRRKTRRKHSVDGVLKEKSSTQQICLI